jgi:hypothetical protein
MECSGGDDQLPQPSWKKWNVLEVLCVTTSIVVDYFYTWTGPVRLCFGRSMSKGTISCECRFGGPAWNILEARDQTAAATIARSRWYEPAAITTSEVLLGTTPCSCPGVDPRYGPQAEGKGSRGRRSGRGREGVAKEIEDELAEKFKMAFTSSKGLKSRTAR